MSAIVLPEGYQYVGAALMTIPFLLLGQNVLVGKYRSLSGIKYPQMYAEKAEADASKDAYVFNCAQRAHQNTLEYVPMVSIVTLVAGIKFPILASALLSFWSLSRVSYTRGYVNGPDRRGTSLYKLGGYGMLGCLLAATYVAGEWVYTGVLNLL